MKMLKTILTWVWCFPQMLAGSMLALITKAEKHGDHYRYKIRAGSVSLGTYVFLCPAHYTNIKILKHEKGHTIQSYILGWLWPFVIGIPSLIWCACFENYRRKYNKSYYDFYTERWANRLSGVDLD